MMFKKFIAYIVSWVLYFIGDLVSHVMHWCDWCNLYPLYNKLMCMSADVQDWAGNSTPWTKISEIERGEECE